jgi:hypothetical protein
MQHAVSMNCRAPYGYLLLQPLITSGLLAPTLIVTLMLCRSCACGPRALRPKAKHHHQYLAQWNSSEPRYVSSNMGAAPVALHGLWILPKGQASAKNVHLCRTCFFSSTTLSALSLTDLPQRSRSAATFCDVQRARDSNMLQCCNFQPVDALLMPTSSTHSNAGTNVKDLAMHVICLQAA